ncbi:MAG: aspartate--tRNA(Asn) ligase [Candidatus Levybacteria bacterium]|nr:aspartate--tRNA(Asn) ligase [Candidatus Levybacteria bacterium]
MSNRILISETVAHVGESISVKGWIHLRRDHGKLIFLSLRDRSGYLQVVVNAQVSQTSYEVAKELRPEYTAEITGTVKKRPANAIDKNSVSGSVELEAQGIRILSKAEVLPFDMGGKDLKLELPTLLDNRSLTLRHPKVSEIFRVQAKVMEGFRKTVENLGCTEIVVPTIVASSTEGGAELFPVDYYGHKALLSQSPQLYKQMMVSVLERVWTIAHAYRAEPSVTTRHLSETTQMDCEFGFVEFGELLDLVEATAVGMLKYVQDSCKVEEISLGKAPRLTLREAQEIIFKEFGRDGRHEKDLAPQDEVDICKWAKEKHKSDLVIITHFPTSAKPFYTMPDPKDPEYSLSYDLLFKGVEVLSGSQRINDYSQLLKSIKDRGMNPKNLEMYLMAFKYGMPPEGGFSFGLERITMKLLNLSNVREASLFPRDMERIDERLSTVDKKNTKTL